VHSDITAVMSVDFAESVGLLYHTGPAAPAPAPPAMARERKRRVFRFSEFIVVQMFTAFAMSRWEICG
jgi:hypothetical protein